MNFKPPVLFARRLRLRSYAPMLALACGLSIQACATLPDNLDRQPSQAIADTADTQLGRAVAPALPAHPGQSGFLLLDSGLDAFVARAVLADFSQRSIDAQYYLYHNDMIGALFTDLLLKAADRGVRVRLLVDDMDLSGRDFGAAALDSHPNLEVRIFNPFTRRSSRYLQFITRFGSVTRRMHNKSFTVDNQVTILGGRNIGNEYFEADPDIAFSDLDVMVIGPAVRDVSSAFDSYWNSELAYPATLLKGGAPDTREVAAAVKQLQEFVAAQADSEYMQALRDSSLANRLRTQTVKFEWGRASVVYDQPEKLLHDVKQTQYHLVPQLEPYFEGVKNELIIFSPYFVPGQAGVAFLTELVEKGNRVRILTNSLASNDVGIVHAGYAKYRKDLLRGGVELYELDKKITNKPRQAHSGGAGSSKASLHAKSFVFDRERVFIGSLNLDPRAVEQNTEIGVIFESAEIGAQMGSAFDQEIDHVAFRLELRQRPDGSDKIVWHGRVNGEARIFETDPYCGFWQRLGVALMGLLPIESQL